jgi:cell division protein FtsI (penicillin-binding protein 3)
MDFGRQIRLWDRLQLSTDIHVDFSGGKKKQMYVPQLVSCLPSVDCGAVPKTATPLKVLLGMSHLLNGGKKIQPHILDRIIEHGGHKEYRYDAFLQEKRGRHVLPSLVSRELLRLLRAQGEESVLETRVLTGETVSLALDYSGGEYVRDQMALFVLSGDKPDLMLLIVSRQNKLEPNVKDGQGLSSLTKNIDSILPSMVALQQISTNIADVVEIQEGEEQNFKSGPDQEQAKPMAVVLKEHSMLMPDLKGVSLRKALRILQRTEHKIIVQGTGRIVSQSPKPGRKLVKGTIINLFLKSDSQIENIE